MHNLLSRLEWRNAINRRKLKICLRSSVLYGSREATEMKVLFERAWRNEKAPQQMPSHSRKDQKSWHARFSTFLYLSCSVIHSVMPFRFTQTLRLIEWWRSWADNPIKLCCFGDGDSIRCRQRSSNYSCFIVAKVEIVCVGIFASIIDAGEEMQFRLDWSVLPGSLTWRIFGDWSREASSAVTLI